MDLEEITQSSVSSPSELIDLEESLITFGASAFQWAFRGQPRTFGTLAPSFQRVFGNRKSVRTAHLIEKNLIKAFRDHYGMLVERPRNMPAPSAIGYNLDLRCLSVMQHYGVPTRLLDWTSDFWIAVYFACTGDPNEDGELWFYDRSIFDHQNDWLPGIGMLRDNTSNSSPPPPEPEILNNQEINLVFELAPMLTPRMTTQNAHHTISTDVFADHAPLIFALYQKNSVDPSDTKGLRRIIIAKGCKEKTLRFLDEHQNVTASTVFPDVEGLGRFLRWQLDSLLTTLL